jgi:23S rRNA (uracil1939-C5)-methyltransferase
LDETGARDVLELYSGVGSLTGMIAAGGRRVVAVEEWPSAVEGLRENLQVNGIHGVTPLLGAAEDVLGDLGGDFQAVVLDPPRGGCHPEVIRAMVDAAVPHVIYVSCNPATLARDLMLLSQGGYVLRRVRPFDMFPQTCHVECVVLMSRL